ncbi:MAG: acyl-ACP--UDP-N-acetylglucosamine O-acyltransferase [Deltaproteobacteria bacterium]|nr:acyl-ACP--UDP-N-acetylglucosamine O-acyltransferase [Deltaproteobacteria bacterium]
MIHPTAIVDPRAELAEEVEVGPYSIIDEHVTIGKGTVIGSHVVIQGRTTIGNDCKIFQFASIGTVPQSLKYKREDTQVIMGDGNIIREYVTIHRGTLQGGGKTSLGSNNFIMAYSHIAHDCHLSNGVIMANAATLAGHIEIEDYAIIGGLTAIHQYVRVGAYAILGGATGVPMDIPPYVCAAGNRARLYGLNIVGLKRHGFSPETIRKLKKTYRIIFRSALNLKEAVAQVKKEGLDGPEVEHLIQFITSSQRGICR